MIIIGSMKDFIKAMWFPILVMSLGAVIVAVNIRWRSPTSKYPPETNVFKEVPLSDEVKFGFVHHHVLLTLTNHPYVSFGGATIVNMTDAEWATITNLHGAVIFTNDLEFYQ